MLYPCPNQNSIAKAWPPEIQYPVYQEHPNLPIELCSGWAQLQELLGVGANKMVSAEHIGLKTKYLEHVRTAHESEASILNSPVPTLDKRKTNSGCQSWHTIKERRSG